MFKFWKRKPKPRTRFNLEQRYYEHLLTKGHTEKAADLIALRWAIDNPMWQTTDLDLLSHQMKKEAKRLREEKHE